MMERRDFLKAGVVGMAASAAAGSAHGADEKRSGAEEPLTAEERLNAPPCGLFCGACGEKRKGRCHGCGCDCGKCNASGHCPQCTIYACASRKGLQSCADCGEFPCTNLIMHACDPIWHVHAPCLENLRRRKAIGTKAWIAEQTRYWSDEDNLRKKHFVETQCQQLVRQLKKTGYTRLW
jgi:hypothetical protein